MANVKKKAKAKAVISNLLVVAVILLLVSFTKNQQSDFLKALKIYAVYHVTSILPLGFARFLSKKI